MLLFGSRSSRGGNQLHTNAVLEFEERLEAIKTGLAQGVDCIVWEDKTRQVEATMSVVEGEAGSSKLTFAAKGSYLIWRAPVRPMQMNTSLKVRFVNTGVRRKLLRSGVSGFFVLWMGTSPGSRGSSGNGYGYPDGFL